MVETGDRLDDFSHSRLAFRAASAGLDGQFLVVRSEGNIGMIALEEESFSIWKDVPETVSVGISVVEDSFATAARIGVFPDQ